eukprot:TRINITY_DN3158_c1_g1_i3.p2 TRINITY_DN3158_c1_g1~~TRINITY_DN3158_c1_g1_i3.p2  ORF type:complete len:395 (+),score=94.24 TRINITY_DN3158_c1_g1_i3:417-1601(+)
MGQKKRVFLCKKFQLRACWAQGNCNGIHADRRRVAELRAKYPPPTDSVEQRIVIFSEADDDTFSVPLSKLECTAGLKALVANGGVLSVDGEDDTGIALDSLPHGVLCPHTLATRCPRRGDCALLHVDRVYAMQTLSIRRARCCGQAKCAQRDGGSASPLSYPLRAGGQQWTHFELVGGSGEEFPRSLLAVTKGLFEACEASTHTDGVLRLRVSSLCRRHSRRVCKWARHCNNIHMCRAALPCDIKQTLTTEFVTSHLRAAVDRNGSSPVADDAGTPQCVPVAESSANPRHSPEVEPDAPAGQQIVVVPQVPQAAAPRMMPVFVQGAPPQVMHQPFPTPMMLQQPAGPVMYAAAPQQLQPMQNVQTVYVATQPQAAVMLAHQLPMAPGGVWSPQP